MRTRPISFTDWVARIFVEQDPAYYRSPKMFMPQMDWITDAEGKVVVDRLIRFENLEAEFQAIMQELGRTAPLPHLKKTQRRAYPEYYDEASIEMVRAWFARDIEHLGYSYSE